jgi:hypothetical protein
MLPGSSGYHVAGGAGSSPCLFVRHEVCDDPGVPVSFSMPDHTACCVILEQFDSYHRFKLLLTEIRNNME